MASSLACSVVKSAEKKVVTKLKNRPYETEHRWKIEGWDTRPTRKPSRKIADMTGDYYLYKKTALYRLLQFLSMANALEDISQQQNKLRIAPPGQSSREGSRSGVQGLVQDVSDPHRCLPVGGHHREVQFRNFSLACSVFVVNRNVVGLLAALTAPTASKGSSRSVPLGEDYHERSYFQNNCASAAT